MKESSGKKAPRSKPAVTDNAQSSLPLVVLKELPRSQPVATLVPELERIRDFVAANGEGMTRDEAILEEITKLLHAKVHDEICVRGGQTPRFGSNTSDTGAQLRDRINHLLQSAADTREGGGAAPTIEFDNKCLSFAVSLLADRHLLGADRDVVGEAYESLIFPALRGGQGQFFTPKNVARCMAELLDVGDGGLVIDPACGTGGFLLEVARSSAAMGKHVNLFGVDKDALLARLAADSIGLQASAATVACGNSLTSTREQTKALSNVLRKDSYDAVITNPPFGSKIPVTGEETLREFDLAYQWALDRRTDRWHKTSSLRESVAPQILFVELCWKLLREGGRCAIVLPEGVLGNQSMGYLRQWLIERADIIAVVDCPLETFLPSTSTKTGILVFERREKPNRPKVFMAVAASCGHDRRGTPVYTESGDVDDDFPRISSAWKTAHSECTQGA